MNYIWPLYSEMWGNNEWIAFAIPVVAVVVMLGALGYAIWVVSRKKW